MNQQPDNQIQSSNQCVHQLFEAQVQRDPGAIAIILDSQQWTYERLNRRANQIARHLMASGLRSEMIVGVCLHRCPELVAGLLGVLKAGGAFVYLDPDDPVARRKAIVDSARPYAVLTDHAHGPKTELAGQEMLDLAQLPETDTGQDDPQLATKPDELAMLLYTSGSTGRPKGVMCSHQMVAESLLLEMVNMPLSHDDRHLFKYAVSHREVFFPLITGGCAVIVPPGKHQDSHFLIQAIIENRITVATLVPSMLQLLLAENQFDNCTTLRYIASGGEVLREKIAGELLSRLNLTLFDNYSLSEAFYVLPRKYQVDGNQGLSVLTLPTEMVVYLLDDDMQEVPQGEVGEIYVGGSCLATGYLNQPELTARRFVTDSPGRFDRLYRTGDRARQSRNGHLRLVGRSDRQVKVRGNRVELGEVESALRQHPAVSEVAVVARNGQYDNQELSAFIISPEDAGLDHAGLRRFLSNSLPDPMIPSAFYFIDQLPLMANGKLDLQLLASLGPSKRERSADEVHEAPQSESEKAIDKVWRDVLAIDMVGVNDNFFDLGGNSFLIAQACARLRKQGWANLQVSTLFDNPTVRLLARHLSEPVAPETSSDSIQQRTAQRESALKRFRRRRTGK